MKIMLAVVTIFSELQQSWMHLELQQLGFAPGIAASCFVPETVSAWSCKVLQLLGVLQLLDSCATMLVTDSNEFLPKNYAKIM
jgi:hypothetical protein